MLAQETQLEGGKKGDLGLAAMAETSDVSDQEEFGQCPQAHGVILGVVLELDLMILMGVFQLRIDMTL